MCSRLQPWDRLSGVSGTPFILPLATPTLQRSVFWFGDGLDMQDCFHSGGGCSGATAR